MYHIHNVCFHHAWRLHVLKPYHSPLTQISVVVALTLWPSVIYFQPFILVWAVLPFLWVMFLSVLLFFSLSFSHCRSLPLPLQCVSASHKGGTGHYQWWPHLEDVGTAKVQTLSQLALFLTPPPVFVTWYTTTKAGEKLGNKAIFNLTGCPVVLTRLAHYVQGDWQALDLGVLPSAYLAFVLLHILQWWFADDWGGSFRLAGWCRLPPNVSELHYWRHNCTHCGVGDSV